MSIMIIIGLSDSVNVAKPRGILNKETQAVEQVKVVQKFESDNDYEGVKKTERTTFEGAYSNDLGIEFVDTWMNLYQGGNIKQLVTLHSDSGIVKRAKVEIDPTIAYTAITVVPRIDDMRLKPVSIIEVQQVIIYVPNKKDKQMWEDWLVQAEQKYIAYQDRQNTPIPTRVIPQ